MSILIALSAFLFPLSYTRWGTMALEFFGRWLVFPWWIYDLWSHQLWLLTPLGGSIHETVFSFLWTLPVIYTSTAIALVANNEFFRQREQESNLGFFVGLIVLIIQVVWPTLLFRVFVDWDVWIVTFIPLPVSPIVALSGLAWIHLGRGPVDSSCQDPACQKSDSHSTRDCEGVGCFHL